MKTIRALAAALRAHVLVRKEISTSDLIDILMALSELGYLDIDCSEVLSQKVEDN